MRHVNQGSSHAVNSRTDVSTESFGVANRSIGVSVAFFAGHRSSARGRVELCLPISRDVM